LEGVICKNEGWTPPLNLCIKKYFKNIKNQNKIYNFVGGQNLGSSPIANSGFLRRCLCVEVFYDPVKKNYKKILKWLILRRRKKNFKILKHGNDLHYYTPTHYHVKKMEMCQYLFSFS
jgi:hypothetical protein